VTETVKAPDCAQAAIDHLLTVMSLPISSDRPKVRPARFLQLVQVPSPGFEAPGYFHGRLTGRAWGKTNPDAADIAATAAAYLEAAEPFYAQCSGPGFLADETGQPTYVFTVELWMHGSNI
jgi:hypothetical protein